MKGLQILMVFILFASLSACRKDHDLVGNQEVSYPIKDSLRFNNQFGVVEFNDEMQRWVINFGTDVMTISPHSLNCTALPITDLPDLYKKQGTELLVVGTLYYSIDSISAITKLPVVRYSVSFSKLKTVPSPDSLWTDYDYIRIKIPGKVLFFSDNQLNMQPCNTATSVNLPDIKVYGQGSGFYYQQKEYLAVTIFDSISRFQNNLPDVVKPGNLPFAPDAKSPGVAIDWNFLNVRYCSTGGGENNRPDSYFKIVRSELVVPGYKDRMYRIGATFRCVIKTNENGLGTRIMGEGQLVTKIIF